MSPILNRRTLLLSSLVPPGVALASSCAGPGNEPGAERDPSTPTPATSGSTGSPRAGRPLLVFFSRAGENYHYGGRRVLEVGNTAVVASMIADLIEVDVHEIEAVDPYPEDYEATVERNTREQDEDARPDIVGTPPPLEDYDTILIGSPVWNVRAPMIMRTLTDAFDFDGKTVHPFVTHAVSDMGRVADEYAEMCAGARIAAGLAVQGEEADKARPDVRQWLVEAGLLAG